MQDTDGVIHLYLIFQYWKSFHIQMTGYFKDLLVSQVMKFGLEHLSMGLLGLLGRKYLLPVSICILPFHFYIIFFAPKT